MTGPSVLPPWSRRRFLQRGIATIAGAGLVTLGASACGEDSAEELAPRLVALFSPSYVLAAGQEQRIPFGLIDQGLPLSDETGPFPVEITRDGVVVATTEVVGRIVAHDHPAGDAATRHEHADLLRYFAVRVTLDEPGIYDLDIRMDGRRATLPFQMFAPDEVVVPLPGEVLAPVAFPTFDNPMGMDPICTRFGGPCPLHAKTIDDAIISGRPVALLVATPAYCSTAYCGPVLDVLLELRPRFDGIEFLHAEVYANPNEVGGNLLDPNLVSSPTVTDLGLPFEPSLFLVDADRIIVDRIDNVFDNSELTEALQRLVRS